MAHQRKGQLTATGEWAKHLRKFWSGERLAERKFIRKEVAEKK